MAYPPVSCQRIRTVYTKPISTTGGSVKFSWRNVRALCAGDRCAFGAVTPLPVGARRAQVHISGRLMGPDVKCAVGSRGQPWVEGLVWRDEAWTARLFAGGCYRSSEGGPVWGRRSHARAVGGDRAEDQAAVVVGSWQPRHASRSRRGPGGGLRVEEPPGYGMGPMPRECDVSWRVFGLRHAGPGLPESAPAPTSASASWRGRTGRSGWCARPSWCSAPGSSQG